MSEKKAPITKPNKKRKVPQKQQPTKEDLFMEVWRACPTDKEKALTAPEVTGKICHCDSSTASFKQRQTIVTHLLKTLQHFGVVRYFHPHRQRRHSMIAANINKQYTSAPQNMAAHFFDLPLGGGSNGGGKVKAAY